MAMKRPAWTVCFFAIWFAIVAAALIMHIAVATIVPAISDLPMNLANGLLAEFGIGTMANESVSIMVSTNTALRMCESDDPDLPESDAKEGRNAQQEEWCVKYTAACTDGSGASQLLEPTKTYAETSVTTVEHVDAILDSYVKSLEKIINIANDKYLGLDGFQEAAQFSRDIKTQADDLKELADGPCCAQIPLYCSLYDLGKGLNDVTQMTKDTVALVSENEGVALFESYANFLNAFHGLPYIVAVCMAFYTLLWWKNGNWCCCENGSCCPDFLIIFFQILFWLVSFVVMAIFTVIGYTISIVFDVTTIDTFPGQPTIQQLIDHVANTYTDFWDLCFKDLVAGMEFFRMATTIFLLVALLIFFHSCCFCCCKPYWDEEAKAAKGAKAEG